ncbi:MAG: ERCC4 domain-containing protein [Candidatus Pacearchaeota archaeon]|jgi:ERCC4-type nuclease
MKTIHNIFSTEKIISKPKKEPPKESIIIDYREKNSLVASELVSLGFKIKFKELKVADYIIKDTAIERKTVNDFLSSMINHRLINQLEELKQYEKKLLLIEGIDEQELYNDENKKINANSIRGFLLSIALKHKVPIIFTKDYCDTAKFIELIARKKQTNFGIRPNKKTKNKSEQIQFILEGFPGIGPTLAKKLLTEFGNLKNIFNANSKELEKSIGKKGEIINKILEIKY